MKGHWFYVTPEEYERAAAIGVDNQTLDRRIRELGWNKERAITTPIRAINKDRAYWRRLAEKNGINFRAFHSRIALGWSDEVAATKPLQTPEERRLNALRATDKVRKIPRKYIEIASQNGISLATLHVRIKKQKLSFEVAATRPLKTKQESGRLGARSLREREGDWAAQIFGKR